MTATFVVIAKNWGFLKILVFRGEAPYYLLDPSLFFIIILFDYTLLDYFQYFYNNNSHAGIVRKKTLVGKLVHK